MHDSKNVTAVCDEPAVLTEEQRKAARWIVAGHANDVQDAIDLMMALGVHPDQKLEEFSTGPHSLHSTAVVPTLAPNRFC